MERARRPELSEPSYTFTESKRMLNRASGIEALNKEIARIEKTLCDTK